MKPGRAWNLAIDQRPAAVAFPESPQDVAAAVLFRARSSACGPRRRAPATTRDRSARLRTRSCSRPSGCGRSRVDPARRTARVEAGVGLGSRLSEAAAQHGLAALAGSSPDVGVVGYTLGGGVSFLGRKPAWPPTTSGAIELVTADGRLVRADPENEPDLFWALRGGGGRLLRSSPRSSSSCSQLPGAYAGILWYPIDRGPEVLHAWRELTQRTGSCRTS